MNLRWEAKAIGNSAGLIRIDDDTWSLNSDREAGYVLDSKLPDSIEITSRIGKLADSEDSFLYLFCEIDPGKENIELSACFEVLESDEVPDYQSGFGIMAADTVFSGSESRHRNHLLAGCFRTVDGRNHGYGLRAVGGYTSPGAAEYTPVRKLDPTRMFQMQSVEDVLLPGDTCYLSLAKTDEGFVAAMQKGEKREILSFPGCDFLMKQDKNRIAIGFAAARKLRIRISDIRVKLSEGKCSEMPADAIRCVIPDYPFQSDLFDDGKTAVPEKEKRYDTVIYVSPDGKDDREGTEAEPMDLQTALQIAGDGSEIVLSDGVYRLQEPLYLPSYSGGSFEKRITVRAKHARQAVLDGSELNKKAPLMVLRGKYWVMDGLVFQNSPLSGFFICGSGNLIRNCEAHNNGDTGFLICAYPGVGKDDWPAYNQVEDCDSYDNCDPVLCNADGFGAKLSVGKGNGFYRCIAHHNIDDGFDLYTKTVFGPIEPVLLEQCVAYENGKTLKERNVRKEHSGGIGFKLGGERQAVEHEVWNCTAFLNLQHDFSHNSNPSVRLHHCTSLENNKSLQVKPLKRYKTILDKGIRPVRKEDGGIDLPWIENKKKSILMLITTLGGGGAERVTTILASELSGKYAVYLLHMYNDGRKAYAIEPEVTVIDGSWNRGTFLSKYFHIPFRWPFKAWSILRAKQKYHIDATISMMHKPNLYNSRIRWRDRRIMSERNDPSRKPAKEYEDTKHSLLKADHVVFQSERVKQLFKDSIQAKSSIIRNPIHVTCFADRISQNRIVTVGRYIEQKNHVLLIRAFHVFWKSHPEYTLHLYGDGELYDELQSLIDELQLQDFVFLEGFQEDIHQHIRNAKMFVLSSDFEGMSNALMEAMMMGLPCISTSCTGSDELLEDGETGLLVPVGDVNALSDAMGRLADDKALCSRLREQAQLQSMEFEKEKVVRAWERILFD